MKRIVLVHWHAGEAEQRAGLLGRGGYRVTTYSETQGDHRALAADPPDVFVIDLGRLPSHGREVGAWLRRQKATRRVPLVFIEGDEVKTARVREMLPDAVFSDWDRIADDLPRALASPPLEPVVPGTMAGYSGTPLPKKLGIRTGAVVALLGAPEGFADGLHPLPTGVQLRRQARGPAKVIVLFAASRAVLKRRFPAAARALAEGGKLWIAWPKKASGVASDLTQAHVRAFGLGHALVDYKIAALDATWSGLCFARRDS